jgi:hypothetical protein
MEFASSPVDPSGGIRMLEISYVFSHASCTETSFKGMKTHSSNHPTLRKQGSGSRMVENINLSPLAACGLRSGHYVYPGMGVVYS